MSNSRDSSTIVGGATPTQPHRDVSAQLNGSHPVNEHGPTTAVFTMANTSSFAPGPVTPIPILITAPPGTYPNMPRADAAQGLTQSPVPVAYSGMYVPAELLQWQQRRPKRSSGRKWIIWGSVITLVILTIVGVVVGVLVALSNQ
ncbi:hypothetical protein BC826DRAFT_654174 [Russula brevipes]|nr:hypothetical protein BC826DRAFT_654174 [Russula brevipes]